MSRVTAQATKKSAIERTNALILAVNSIIILLPLLLLSIIIPSATSNCSDFTPRGAHSA